ncbi:MAG: 50S ribosomal protein L21 [Candidatus Glassbacteria bacterium]|nr:50S ribosomal protein L21 [Candidatus Glassbacteria bacterium]
MYAIAQSGDKQFKIEKNSVVRVPTLDLPVGEKLRLEQILLFNQDGRVEVGNPFIEGAYADARVLRHGRAKKITIIKYKRRKDYRRKLGHRQGFTEILVESIVPGTGKKAAAEKVEKKLKEPVEARPDTVKEQKPARKAVEVSAKKKPAAPAAKAEATKKKPAAAAPAGKAKAAKKEPAAAPAGKPKAMAAGTGAKKKDTAAAKTKAGAAGTGAKAGTRSGAGKKAAPAKRTSAKSSTAAAAKSKTGAKASKEKEAPEKAGD